jgi:hypothetical protein
MFQLSFKGFCSVNHLPMRIWRRLGELIFHGFGINQSSPLKVTYTDWINQSSPLKVSEMLCRLHGMPYLFAPRNTEGNH